LVEEKGGKVRGSEIWIERSKRTRRKTKCVDSLKGCPAKHSAYQMMPQGFHAGAKIVHFHKLRIRLQRDSQLKLTRCKTEKNILALAPASLHTAVLLDRPALYRQGESRSCDLGVISRLGSILQVVL
jgi:hypothetical protein